MQNGISYSILLCKMELTIPNYYVKWGISYESLFFQELKAVNDYYGLGYKIYYWRTGSNLEVDFVLYGDRGLKACYYM